MTTYNIIIIVIIIIAIIMDILLQNVYVPQYLYLAYEMYNNICLYVFRIGFICGFQDMSKVLSLGPLGTTILATAILLVRSLPSACQNSIVGLKQYQNFTLI